MKNPTILKGELSLLRADKSAVLTELRKAGKQLKDERTEINKLEQKREGVRALILEDMARLDTIRARAFSEGEQLSVIKQELKNKEAQHDSFVQKHSQEEKLYLGRIKTLREEEEETIVEIGRLKSLFDKNSLAYNNLESERLTRLRDLGTEIATAENKLKELEKELGLKEEQEKKITKDRLKREDKLRLREKNLDGRELSIKRREEDLITMSKDMTIVYGRLKELYSKTNPNVDLDKLILQAL